MDHVQLGAAHPAETLRGQVLQPAKRAGDRVQSGGLGFGIGDQLRQRMDVERARHQDRIRLLGDESDRLELVHVERHIGMQHRQRDEYRAAGEEQRVAVGRGIRGGARGIQAAGAGLIDHNDFLAPDQRKLLGDKARQCVERAARRRLHDDLDRPAGIIVGVRDRRGSNECYRESDAPQDGSNCAHLGHSARFNRAPGRRRAARARS